MQLWHMQLCRFMLQAGIRLIIEAAVFQHWRLENRVVMASVSLLAEVALLYYIIIQNVSMQSSCTLYGRAMPSWAVCWPSSLSAL